jgi:hypothetical protein
MADCDDRCARARGCSLKGFVACSPRSRLQVRSGVHGHVDPIEGRAQVASDALGQIELGGGFDAQPMIDAERSDLVSHSAAQQTQRVQHGGRVRTARARTHHQVAPREQAFVAHQAMRERGEAGRVAARHG